MFGSDDSKKQAQDSSGIMPTTMPDPIDTPSLSGMPSMNSGFGAPSSTPVVPAAPDLSIPEIGSTATPDLPAEQTGVPPISPATEPSTPPTDDLLELKQQALQHLSPLVGQLDQTPEEKFRTTMMMIQASDDKSLIKSAFEAAQLITDDKPRAQALLDVINEINYFTQHQS